MNLELAHITALALATIFGVEALTNPHRKTWWSKRVASDLFHVAGRLSERQIKYCSETGFRTLISLYAYDEHIGDVSAVGGNYLPNTTRTRYVCEELGMVAFHVLLDRNVTDWRTTSTLSQAYSTIHNSARPVLFFSDTSYAATYILLLYFVNVTMSGATAAGVPRVDHEAVYTIGAELGFSFGEDDKLRGLLTELTGSDLSSSGHRTTDTDSPDWYRHYWQMKPVDKNIFISGQIQKDQLKSIEAAGVRCITNTREGNWNPVSGARSQEEVTLLNVKDRTGTYTGAGRQSVQQLEANRIDPDKPNAYISEVSAVNYDMNNTGEFGDSIGYNETLERTAVQNTLREVVYFHLPIGGQYNYDKSMWNAYRETLQAMDEKGNVLLHCRTGFRSGTLGILWTAYKYCYNSTWALNRGKEIGYNLAVRRDVKVLFEETLDNRVGCVPYEVPSSTQMAVDYSSRVKSPVSLLVVLVPACYLYICIIPGC